MSYPFWVSSLKYPITGNKEIFKKFKVNVCVA